MGGTLVADFRKVNLFFDLVLIGLIFMATLNLRINAVVLLVCVDEPDGHDPIRIMDN